MWKEKLKTSLRDPAWASIRAIIAFLALLASPIVLWYFSSQTTPKTSISSNKLIIYQSNTKSLTDIPNTIAGRTRILIDGKDERDVKLYEYIIDFQGDHPIRAGDFEAAIRGLVPSDRKILAVQQSKDTGSESVLSIPGRVGKTGNLERASEPQIECEIRKVDETTFEVVPLLINPNDWFRIEIYTATVTGTKESKSSPPTSISRFSEIAWSCRIAGVQCPAPRDYDALLRALVPDPTDPLKVSISAYSGWSVYFIVLFTISNLIVLLALARRTRVAITSPTLKLFLFAVAVFLSMATSEILADWWFNAHSLQDQPFAATLLFLLDLAVIVALTGICIARRKIVTVTSPTDASLS
jgi:hypothetical protein